jgi:hypothetical protein
VAEIVARAAILSLPSLEGETAADLYLGPIGGGGGARRRVQRGLDLGGVPQFTCLKREMVKKEGKRGRTNTFCFGGEFVRVDQVAVVVSQRASVVGVFGS